MRLEIGEDRNASGLGEGTKFSGSVREIRADTSHDHGALGRSEHIESFVYGLSGRSGVDFEQDLIRNLDGIFVNLCDEHVHREIEQHRSSGRGRGQANGFCDEAGNLLRDGDAVSPFRDRSGDGKLIDAGLQRVSFGISEGAGTAKIENGRAVEIGVRNRSDDIRKTGAGGGHGDAEGTSGARVAFGGVSGGHFVEGVGDGNFVIEAGLKNRFQVGAVKSKDLADVGAKQSADQQFAAGDHGHGNTPD
jgi:hypothetical protein